MPCTLAALAEGTTSEYRAQLIAQEFGCLSPQDRIAAVGIAGRLDPAAVLAKIRGAVDTMLRLSALLPLTSGMAAFFALRRCGDLGRAEGDNRSRDQFMADELVARLTNPPTDPPGGEAEANTQTPTNPPINPPTGVTDPAHSSPTATSESESEPTATDPPAGVADPDSTADANIDKPTTGCDDYGAPLGSGGP